MARYRRLGALLLCAVAALALLCASVCVAGELAHPHACTGEGCPICALIAQAEGVARSLGMALAVWVAAIPLLARRAAPPAFEANALALPDTPVRRKTRLND